jgi:hypothetical protein
MLETNKKTIMGHEYACTLFPAMKAYKLVRKLFSILAAENNIDKLIEVDEDGQLILEILSDTVRDDLAITKGTFDNIYSGNLKELIEALKFVVEVNFSDFLGEGGIGNLMQSPQNTKTVSTIKLKMKRASSAKN